MRIGRVRPCDGMRAVAQRRLGREELRTADPLEPRRRQLRNHDLAFLRRDPGAVPVLHKIRGGPAAVGQQRRILPHAVAVRQIEAAHLAVAVDTVDITVAHKRGHNDAVQGVGLALIHALPLPEQRRRRSVPRQFVEPRPVVKRGKKKLRPRRVEHRIADMQDHVDRLVRLLPPHLARGRIERGNPSAGPGEHDLALTEPDQPRRGIRRLSVQRAPALAPGLHVEGDHTRIGRTADLENHDVPRDERRTGQRPDIQFRPVVRREIARPEHLARRGIEGVRVAHRPIREGPPVDDGHGRPRPEGIVDVAVDAGVAVGPKQPAGGAIKTQHALLLLGRIDAIRQKNALSGDRRAAVARADGGGPDGLQLWTGEFLDNAGLAPDAVALRSAPLRPVVGHERRRATGHHCSENQAADQGEGAGHGRKRWETQRCGSGKNATQAFRRLAGLTGGNASVKEAGNVSRPVGSEGQTGVPIHRRSCHRAPQKKVGRRARTASSAVRVNATISGPIFHLAWAVTPRGRIALFHCPPWAGKPMPRSTGFPARRVEPVPEERRSARPTGFRRRALALTPPPPPTSPP